MDMEYISREGDTVDLVCFRHYGHTVGTTETVLAANPGLAALGPVLPRGTGFVLPALGKPEGKPRINEGRIQLWD